MAAMMLLLIILILAVAVFVWIVYPLGNWHKPFFLTRATKYTTHSAKHKQIIQNKFKNKKWTKKIHIITTQHRTRSYKCNTHNYLVLLLSTYQQKPPVKTHLFCKSSIY